MGSVSVPLWAALLIAVLPALIALAGTITALRSQRRSARESNEISRQNADAAMRASSAADRASSVADRAAKNAESAAGQLHKFRLHDDTMRTLYWAADHAVVADSSRALLGLEVLATLVEQAEEDADQRGHRLVRATSDAVQAVAVPTFLSVITSAVSEDADGNGVLTVSAVELNAAKLLLAHGRDLSAELRLELEGISAVSVGRTIGVRELHAARHMDSRVELARERERARERDRSYGLSREITR